MTTKIFPKFKQFHPFTDFVEGFRGDDLDYETNSPQNLISSDKNGKTIEESDPLTQEEMENILIAESQTTYGDIFKIMSARRMEESELSPQEEMEVICKRAEGMSHDDVWNEIRARRNEDPDQPEETTSNENLDQDQETMNDTYSDQGMYFDLLYSSGRLYELIRARRSRDSKVLTELVRRYLDDTKRLSGKQSIDRFWKRVEFGDPDKPKPSREECYDINFSGIYLNQEKREVLYKARSGNLKAVQILVRSHPETIYLPFVARVMLKIMLTQKYGPRGNLQDNKDIWTDFLSKRAGGVRQYDEEDLKFLIAMEKKYGEKINTKGQKVPLNKEDAAAVIEDKLGDIKAETIRKKGASKGRKGRPPKKPIVK